MTIIKLEEDDSGNLNMIRKRVYFPRSEFHCRFPSLFTMDDPVRWSSYHRSIYKKIEGTSNSNAYKFQGNQSAITAGMYPKTGNFYNPFHFYRYQQALKPNAQAISTYKDAAWYDYLLTRQKKAAAFVVETIKATDPNFVINCDNH